jgi:hypothetical protein
MTTAQSSPAVLRFTRASAVVITTAIGVASFILSFAALRDLAIRGGWPPHLAWLWPVIVDGAILMATMAVVALAPHTDQVRSRRFFWTVLAASAAVSIGCNAIHAVIPRTIPLSPWLAAGIAMVPPAMLLASTHGLSLLAKVGRMVQAVESAPAADVVTTPRPQPEHAQWTDMAEALGGHPATEGLTAAQITDVVYLSYERGQSNRSIGRNLDLDPRAVGKVVAASAEVLASGALAIDPALIAPRSHAVVSATVA